MYNYFLIFTHFNKIVEKCDDLDIAAKNRQLLLPYNNMYCKVSRSALATSKHQPYNKYKMNQQKY